MLMCIYRGKECLHKQLIKKKEREAANKVKIMVSFAMIIKMSFPFLLQQMRFEAQKSWSNFWRNQLFIRNN